MGTVITKQQALAIADLASGVRDNGRRGTPRKGCDCVQCFGYCHLSPERQRHVAPARSSKRELNFDDDPIT